MSPAFRVCLRNRPSWPSLWQASQVTQGDHIVIRTKNSFGCIAKVASINTQGKLELEAADETQHISPGYTFGSSTSDFNSVCNQIIEKYTEVLDVNHVGVEPILNGEQNHSYGLFKWFSKEYKIGQKIQFKIDEITINNQPLICIGIIKGFSKSHMQIETENFNDQVNLHSVYDECNSLNNYFIKYSNVEEIK